MSQQSEPENTGRWWLGAEGLNNIVQTVAIVAAGAWAVYTFVYQAKIAPGLEPPSLSVTSTLEKAGHKGDQVAIRSTVTRNNVGHTGVRLLALTYNVIGSRVRFLDGAASEPGFSQDPSRSNTIMATRYYDEPQHEVILRHGVLFAGATALPSPPSVLNPGETISRDLIFYADHAKFDTVRFQVRMTYSKESDQPVPLRFRIDDRGELEAVPLAGCSGDADACPTVMTTDFATDLSLW